MTRPPRRQYAGAILHVVNRGVDRQPIFTDDRDRRRFLRLLGDAQDILGFDVHAWCLMGNHYHLLVGVPDANIDKVMQRLGGRYAGWFNHRHARDGPLCKGRYFSRVVERDDDLVQVVRYIHRNPLEAGIVDSSPAAYRWSSHRVYVGESAGESRVRTDLVLGLFGDDRHRFARFVLADTDADADPAAGTVSPAIVFAMIEDAIDDCGDVAPNRLLATIERAAPQGPAPTHTQPGRRGRRPDQARSLALGLAAHLVDDIDAIVRHFGLGSDSSVRSARRRFHRRLADDAALRTDTLRMLRSVRAATTTPTVFLQHGV